MITFLRHPMITEDQQDGFLIESRNYLSDECFSVIELALNLPMPCAKGMASMVHTNDVSNEQSEIVRFDFSQDVSPCLGVKRVQVLHIEGWIAIGPVKEAPEHTFPDVVTCEDYLGTGVCLLELVEHVVFLDCSTSKVLTDFKEGIKSPSYHGLDSD